MPIIWRRLSLLLRLWCVQWCGACALQVRLVLASTIIVCYCCLSFLVLFHILLTFLDLVDSSISSARIRSCDFNALEISHSFPLWTTNTIRSYWKYFNLLLFLNFSAICMVCIIPIALNVCEVPTEITNCMTFGRCVYSKFVNEKKEGGLVRRRTDNALLSIDWNIKCWKCNKSKWKHCAGKRQQTQRHNQSHCNLKCMWFLWMNCVRSKIIHFHCHCNEHKCVSRILAVLRKLLLLYFFLLLLLH